MREHSTFRRRLARALVLGAALLTSAVLVLAAGRVAAGDLLFYTSVPRNLAEPLIKAFEAGHADVTVRLFQAGAETLLAKIDLEIKGRSRPDADVLWIEDTLGPAARSP